MRARIDLAGTTFGVWSIIDHAESDIDNTGTLRSYWNVRCNICEHKFVRKTYNIRQRRRAPTDCPNCMKGKKLS